ncbi:MAG: hypothetical protein NVSMB10_03100 [Steroidobacteraceae bacterium]
MSPSRFWVSLSLAAGALASAAAEPPVPPAPPPPVSAPGTTPPASVPPNEEFLEFLGMDDVSDPAVWEFLQKSAGQADVPSVPPQDAKK